MNVVNILFRIARKRKKDFVLNKQINSFADFKKKTYLCKVNDSMI